jgi:hypothetical protein
VVMEKEKDTNDKKVKLAEFDKLTDPLVKYLNENYDPHTTIIIRTNGSELLRGEMGIPNDKYYKD